MNAQHLHPRLNVPVQLTLSAAFLTLSATLLFLHAADVRETRDVGLPAALQMPAIEQRMQILKEQSDAAQLQASITGGSSEEMLHVYTLPATPSLDHVLATFTTVFTALQSSHDLHAAPSVHIGTTVDAPPPSSNPNLQSLQRTPVSFEADVTEAGLRNLLLFPDIAGLLTVSDALSKNEINQLLTLTEQENPSAITALESYLATDLLSYVQDPASFDDLLLRAFSSDTFDQSFHTIIAASALMGTQRLLHGSMGKALDEVHLWPLRFLLLTKATVTDKGNGAYHVAMNLDAYSRKSN